MARIREAAKIVRDAGGRLVGRTRLQKLAYLLEVSGLGDGYSFEYRRFGPYSEELFNATRDACLLSLLDEAENPTPWGGTVSIYSVPAGPVLAEPDDEAHAARRNLAHVAARADSIELELAATALFLHQQGERRPWFETARRKPDKADGDRLARAIELYQRIREIQTPNPLPVLDDAREGQHTSDVPVSIAN